MNDTGGAPPEVMSKASNRPALLVGQIIQLNFSLKFEEDTSHSWRTSVEIFKGPLKHASSTLFLTHRTVHFNLSDAPDFYP